MKFRIAKLKPALALRIGLGLTFIYAGIMSFLAPENWIGFVPQWIGSIIDPMIFLQIHAGFEIVLGLALLVGLWLPLVALLAFLDIFAILLFYGIDEVTFRDFGLLMAALALYLLISNNSE
jgi:uncharacterized membrane protein YphA (DoxX/SURF4 family)